jgi:hypothetical protein
MWTVERVIKWFTKIFNNEYWCNAYESFDGQYQEWQKVKKTFLFHKMRIYSNFLTHSQQLISSAMYVDFQIFP